LGARLGAGRGHGSGRVELRRQKTSPEASPAREGTWKVSGVKFLLEIRLEETNQLVACTRQTEQPNNSGGERMAGLPETNEARGGAWGSFWR
jgi:hypothetical protein